MNLWLSWIGCSPPRLAATQLPSLPHTANSADGNFTRLSTAFAGARLSLAAYDNAMIESFWSTLKTESTARNHFKTRAEARLAVFDFIEGVP